MGEWKEYKASPWGIIPTHWKISSIKEETDVVTDYVANGSFASLAENVKYKSEKDYAVLIRLVDYNNQFRGDFVYIDKNAYEFLGKSKLYGDEIIISNVGANVGTVFRCPHLGCKMSLAPNSIMVKFNGNNDFYYYWLKSRFGQHMLKSIVTGSAQPKFNKTNFRDLQIPVPPLDEQESIASILKTLDDKIELNRRINENLEQQAQALFKSWFVDFEPFKNGEFVESELGMIPKGWRVGKVGEICKFENGFAFQSDSYTQDGSYKVITIKNVQDGYLDSCGANLVSDIPPKMPISCKLDIGDILLSLTGNVGRCCFVTEKKLLLNQRVAKINPKKDINWGFIYTLFRVPDFKNTLISIARGTAQANLSPVETSKLAIVIPPEDIMKQYSILTTEYYKKIISNMIQSADLASLRDTLLPKLMSGELKVNEL